MNNRRLIISVTALALVMAFIVAGMMLIATHRPASPEAVVTGDRTAVVTEQIPVKPVGAPGVGAEYCEEDMPCWDCATMGNMVCGTIDDSAQAWETFDANGGPALLPTDLQRPFRVDYVTSTPEYPQNLTERDVIVQGADGTWYVFAVTFTDVPEETSDFEEPADLS